MSISDELFKAMKRFEDRLDELEKPTPESLYLLFRANKVIGNWFMGIYYDSMSAGRNAPVADSSWTEIDPNTINGYHEIKFPSKVKHAYALRTVQDTHEKTFTYSYLVLEVVPFDALKIASSPPKPAPVYVLMLNIHKPDRKGLGGIVTSFEAAVRKSDYDRWVETTHSASMSRSKGVTRIWSHFLKEDYGTEVARIIEMTPQDS